MKAIRIENKDAVPVLTDIPAPKNELDDQVVVNVQASALSNLAKHVAMGTHYSSDGVFPKTVGLDGVGTLADGTFVYFDHPIDGAMAEQVVVPKERVIRIPAGLTAINAAALPNPGMSSYAALMYRAHLQKGETVLVNGATGVAGQLAVKIARALGAKRVIATGRRQAALAESGADIIVPSEGLDLSDPKQRQAYQTSVAQVVGEVDVVLDYLFGTSAEILLETLAQVTGGSHPVRYIEIGANDKPAITLSAALLRSSKIEMMGSGLHAVDDADLQTAVAQVFVLAAKHHWAVPTRAYAAKDIQQAWQAANHPRAVIHF